MGSSWHAERATTVLRQSSVERLKLDVAIAVAAGLWIALVVYFVGHAEQVVLGDFVTYWQGARRLDAGAPLYADFQLLGRYGLGAASFGQGYVYPPSAAYLTLPLAVLDLVRSWLFFVIVSTAALGAVAFRIAVREGLSRPAAALAAALVVLSGPGLESLITGNANALAAVGIGVAWLFPHWSGLPAVVGGVVKVFPFGGLAWTLRTRGNLVAPALIGVAVAVLTSQAAGFGAWGTWARAFLNGVPSGDFMLISPRLLFQEFFGPAVAFPLAVGASVLLLWIVATGDDDRRDIFLLSLAVILPATDWFLHYLIVPLIGGLPAICHWVAERGGERVRSSGSRPYVWRPAI